MVVLLAVIGATLSACGGSAVPPGTTNVSYNTTAAGAPPQTQTQTQKAPPRRVQTQKPKTTPKKTAAIPLKPLAADTLAGLSEKAVMAKIGEPELIRSEGETIVWQYRSDQCSFDMFFSPSTKSDAKSDPRELRHILARMRRGNDRISVQDCLDQVRQERLSRG